MERIAIAADIHANMHALDALMKYLDQECSVSQILNLGDFIQIGPNPAEVFDAVMNDSRFVSIMGNSEAMFFDEEMKQHYASEAAHQDWVISMLGSERMERLRQVPLHRIVEIGNRKILMVHARMNRAMDTPLLYDRRTLEEFISDYDADVSYVLIGHTHLPLYAVHWNNKPIINPGSVGCGKDGIVRFAVMEMEDGLVNITYKQLKYDKEKVIRDYRENSVPCCEKFIAMFY